MNYDIRIMLNTKSDCSDYSHLNVKFKTVIHANIECNTEQELKEALKVIIKNDDTIIRLSSGIFQLFKKFNKELGLDEFFEIRSFNDPFNSYDISVYGQLDDSTLRTISSSAYNISLGSSCDYYIENNDYGQYEYVLMLLNLIDDIKLETHLYLSCYQSKPYLKKLINLL